MTNGIRLFKSRAIRPTGTRHDYVTKYLHYNFIVTKIDIMAINWNNADTFKLIEELERRPMLYDTKCVGYTNRDLRRSACDEIGRLFGVSGT